MRIRARPSGGFTLVELLIAAALGGFVMIALLSSSLFLARNFTRLANYQALESEARRALAYLQADLEQAEAVKPGTNPTAIGVTLVLPAGEVTYAYDSGTQRLRRQADFGASPDISLLSGAHNYLVPEVIKGLSKQGVKVGKDILIVVGGIIPESDFEGLKKAGVSMVFTPGTSVDSIIISLA